MKTSAQHSDGSGLVYRGPFVSGADGTVLESGRYSDYGSRTDIVPAGTVTAATNRWHFSGKEDQAVDFSLPFVDFGARQYSPTLGRWLVPDPAGEEYYEVSPYVYCANDPVNLVDEDGRKIWIFDNDTKTAVEYRDMELYDMNGEKYTGSNDFVLTIQQSLNDLLALNDKSINHVISSLENSPRVHEFAYNSGYRDSVVPRSDLGNSLAHEGAPVDTWIRLSLKNSSVDGVENNTLTTIGHELWHAYDFDRGSCKGLMNDQVSSMLKKETPAVIFENIVRKKLGMTIRTKYDGKTVINK